MRMRSILILFASILLVVAFQNCSRPTFDNPIPFGKSQGTSIGNPSEPVNFKTVSSRVFQPSCVSCHGASDNVRYDSFDQAINNGRLNVLLGHYRALEIPSTNCAPISVANMNLLVQWIELGAPDENGNPGFIASSNDGDDDD